MTWWLWVLVGWFALMVLFVVGGWALRRWGRFEDCEAMGLAAGAGGRDADRCDVPGA